MSAADDGMFEVPSDVEIVDAPTGAAVTGAATVDTKPLAYELLRLAALTDRGISASAEERSRVDALATELEASGGGGAPLDGDWRLIWASDAPYRSSPFCMCQPPPHTLPS